MDTRASNWKSLNQAAEQAYEASDYSAAEARYLDALRATRRLRTHDRRRLKSIEGLAHVYKMMHKDALASAVYKGMMRVVETVYGPDDPRVAECLEHYVLMFVLDNLAESEALLRRSLAIRQRAWGLDCPDLALCDVSFGYLHARHGNLEAAETHFRKAIQRIERGRGYRHPDLVFYLRQLAGFLRIHNRYEEAEPLYERVLALVEHGRGWGEEALIEALEDLGRVHRFLGKEEKAQRLFERIRELWRRRYGDILSA